MTQKAFISESDRRLDLAQSMAKQLGLGWCGIGADERDVFLDAAGAAIAAADGKLAALRAERDADFELAVLDALPWYSTAENGAPYQTPLTDELRRWGRSAAQLAGFLASAAGPVAEKLEQFCRRGLVHAFEGDGCALYLRTPAGDDYVRQAAARAGGPETH